MSNKDCVLFSLNSSFAKKEHNALQKKKLPMTPSYMTWETLHCRHDSCKKSKT